MKVLFGLEAGEMMAITRDRSSIPPAFMIFSRARRWIPSVMGQ